MGLRFLLGRAGTGKSGRTMDEIKEKLLDQPNGTSIFYIVPDQMTFQQESALFHDKDIVGSIRAQVVSFSRLAWRILQETGGGTKQFISSVGVQMMLRKIIEEKTDDWRVFQKAMEKQGFLSQLEKMITEFKRYNISPEALQSQMKEIEGYVHKESGEEALISKLDDLAYIYENLMVALQDKYIDSEDQLQLLADKISESSLLEDAEVYLDGFHRFTPNELVVVEALLKKCKSVTIALTVDGLETEASELDLFYQTVETYHQIQQIAIENQIPLEETVQLDPANGRFSNRPYFAHLEQYFDVRPAPQFDGETPIRIAEAVHPRAEVEGVAQEVIRLVREENYRFRDLAVFIRQTDTYHDLIATIFEDYDIPVFIDEKRTMLNHSLIEFIRSVLDIVEGNWRYDAIFRVLKTGFIPVTDKEYPLTADAIDELENYVLEYGIRSRNRWLGDEEWVFQRFRGFDQATQTDTEKEIQKRINRYRKQVVSALAPFDEDMRRVSTIRELCERTYLLLEELNVPNRLEQMRELFDERSEIEKGREQEQVWNAVIQLFDEMVEMAGEETMTLTTFRATLDAGFETLKFAHVPPSIDHVIVGTIDRSRISGIKCSFLLGVNEGVWPMKPSGDGMINEQERELLAGHGLRLAETSKRQLLDDWFYMYIAFTSAKDKLWVSYPLSDEEGKSKMPSQLIKRVEDLFPICCEHLLLQDPDELVEADRFITTPTKTRSALTAQLARNRKGYPVKPIWWHVLNWYITHHDRYSTTYNVLQSLFYENKPINLDTETVEKLYPKQVKASVSRLETYYRCSYQHFAKYSLGLDERKTYKLDAPDIGQLFHEALKTITEWVQQEGRNFAQLTKNDTDGYARKAVTNLAPILQHQILHSSNRYKYIQQKLQEVIARAAYILSEQARQSNFSPVGLELGFGTDQKLPPLTLPLPNGYELMLRGRIDRIDQAINNESLFLRIIDYKSSSKGLNLLEVYYGLALQMLTYLDVVLTHSETWLGVKATPAGVLYFHVHNPMISGDQKLPEDKIEEEIFKKYKMQGLLLSDEDIVKMMDNSLESGTSTIVPAGVKKNGGFYSSSKIADEDTFTSLQTHIHQLMMQAGIDMTAGGVHLNPYQHKQQIACTYCPFHAVCQFDPLLEDNNYRKLTEMKEETILEKIRVDEGEVK
ncbi:helicase-exonuclease AddAB subunit AddB [Virgibacillus halodenitrificans]|uniref:helicase-exonuclease AddAB subunit AddB n=1 Tax=Virgibacillus halodenitrificans TaxID=1482 RepID=UPI00045CA591|nr:helicase-exonuclease AddAB subunit AddB [Virgibacillus halodenitrificans]MCG1029507.1 helicase-exonuclease AddAB subunit AddB [Virgibacillus halodenitrificans]CDQ32281.1 ATP-dependent helicase/deoxyribonuclease subunit B [Virgibacillus halodenitrificans]